MLNNIAWSIPPTYLVEIYGTLGSRAAPNRPAFAPPSANINCYAGTALIPITGILGKVPSRAMELFGGTSTVTISRQLEAALDDSSVQSILLYIDSPGGTVDGTQALAEKIQAARGKKPIVALADGSMCSAAYWIGSSADKVFASSETTQIGSIGVVAAHLDVSGREQQLGIKTTEITAGKYKRVASNYRALDSEGRSTIQEAVDYLYSLFVAHVARARGVSEKTVIQKMADGRMFIGRQAVSAGLIDGIKSLDECIKGASSMITQRSNSTQTAQANGREMLHQKAKRYQAEHPGMDLMTALKAVSDDVLPANTGTAEGDRFDLHKKARAYQAKHPGTPYIDAFQVVANDRG